jgi:hypothetical protein
VYRYRCDQCRTTSLPVSTWAEVLQERDRHRRRTHGGAVPDGEHLLRARRRPQPAEWRPALALLIFLLLPVLDWITRHL